MKLIGIAGGSGSGKSSVSRAIVQSNPKMFEVVSLDDYQKLKTDPSLPNLKGMANWDHPDAIRWDEILADIKRWNNNEEVVREVWTSDFNPDYFRTGKMMKRIIKPKPVMIIEGYLAIYNPTLNELLNRKYYLELDAITRQKRRNKGEIIRNDLYEAEVLSAMHNEYVEPTKRNADLVINVSQLSLDEVSKRLLADINDFLVR